MTTETPRVPLDPPHPVNVPAGSEPVPLEPSTWLGSLWNRRHPIGGTFMACFALLALWMLIPSIDGQTLVVYCAHDAEFAEPIMRRFEQEAGVRVLIRYDTEATKSLGLVNRLKSEIADPQCDVFWNNELLGTLDLAANGLLEEYQGPGYKRIPSQFRDPHGQWAGFAARLRLLISASEVVPTSEADQTAVLQGDDLSRVTMAKPMFGTTLTQYALWWESLGGPELRRRHADWLQKGLRIADGNAAAKNLVAGGGCDLGFTDTDDYFVALDAGRRIAAAPVRVAGRTICIPNTVSIIRGTRRKETAAALVDFLLSEETEIALARSPARQIPLGAVSADQLPAEVRQLQRWAEDAADLRGLLPARIAVLEWLRQEFEP